MNNLNFNILSINIPKCVNWQDQSKNVNNLPFLTFKN